MEEYLRKIGGQIWDFLKGLSPLRKVGMALVTVGIIVALTLMFAWVGDTNYQPLMSNLNPEDSANVIRILREKRIPFKVDQGGKVISIPPESLYEFRLELATMGLPQSSVVGYEVFDKQPLGTTSFVQKVNQKRALEGELMRTIKTIRGVKFARVHLALPPKSAFVEDQKKSTASVVVDLEPGAVLAEKQVYGIGNLVARAVEGMDVTDVVIVDSNGKVLSKNPSDPLAVATATQLDFRQKFESDLERRIQEMLGHVVGDGRVVARVSADIDFSQVAETQTVYDADGSAIRSVQKDVKVMDGTRPSPVGPAGVAANTPGQPPAQSPMVKNNTNIQNELTNFEVPQTVKKTMRPAWSIKRLSVAVVVDGKQVKTTAPDGTVTSKVDPWTPEKIKEFETIVTSAAGIDPKRGDTLDIKNMEFTRTDFDEAQKMLAEHERKSYIQNIVVYAVVGLTIVLFFLLVVRPFIKWVTENTIDSVDTFLPQTIEELERMQKNAVLPGLEDAMPVVTEKVDPDKIEGEMIKEKIISLVDASPHKAALVLRDWLHSEKDKKRAAGEEAGKGKSA